MKQKRPHSRTETSQAVSLYDSQDYFRGQAIFETEKEARKYMKIYQSTLQVRNEQNNSNNQDRKIFRENKRPKISYPPYYKRHRYN